MLGQSSHLKKDSISSNTLSRLDLTIERASQLTLSQQSAEGYWWYTLEANDSINAELILLYKYLNITNNVLLKGIQNTLIKSQNQNGSWSLYYGDDGDLSTTIECYLALKLNGLSNDSQCLTLAKKFILSRGGLTKCRVFTRIHLAMFGLISWDLCPIMPLSLMGLPNWSPINIYEFSSWARACIVPLLVLLDQKRTVQIPKNLLDELYLDNNPQNADWSLEVKPTFSSANFFVQLDKILHKIDFPDLNPFRGRLLKKCEAYIREHIEKTEDIYPALAYSAMALHALGFPTTDKIIVKCLKALESFRITQEQEIYQQCCISPVWDTPWAGIALRESGISKSNQNLIKSGEWLISKQILTTRGDWAVKNKKGRPGGWSFEFENEYFPDVDDSIEVLLFLMSLDFPQVKLEETISRGLEWILSMQSKNGGWGAFDIDNDLKLLNKIPFSDHGACLDPPTADITARALELLAKLKYNINNPIVAKAVRFIENEQDLNSGAWEGRWGVNYLYGTWCVLQGLNAIGYPMQSERIQKSVKWLKSKQNSDGGFGESCDSYLKKCYVPLSSSVPSQTAWALMALIAAGEDKSLEAKNAANYLINNQNIDGSWDEPHFTGTGFPGHFYIRYHGYRQYFPLLALAKYRNSALSN